MRSQKINNRPPRPFKNQNASGQWSGGGGFIPAPKFPKPVKKAEKAPLPPEETSESK